MLISEYSLRREGEARELSVVVGETHHHEKGVVSPNEVYNIIQSLYDVRSFAQERVYMIALINKRCAGLFEVSRGGFDGSYCSPKEIFSMALLVGATRIVVAHNHPSLDTTPSSADIEIAKRLKEAGDIIQVELVDFLILGDGYYSFADHQIV